MTIQELRDKVAARVDHADMLRRRFPIATRTFLEPEDLDAWDNRLRDQEFLALLDALLGEKQ
jgi:hypothetical protein